MRPGNQTACGWPQCVDWRARPQMVSCRRPGIAADFGWQTVCADRVPPRRLPPPGPGHHGRSAPVSAGLFGDLTRTELDQWIAAAEDAERRAHIALVNAPLDGVSPYLAAGVAADALDMQMDLYGESIARMLAGDIPEPWHG